MHYFGVVTSGRTATVVLADDFELAGQVVRANGDPVPNIEVKVSDAGHGHMSGYPGTVLRTATTDFKGRYRVRGLPNCVFNVSLGDISKVLNMPCALLAKASGDKEWSDLGIHNTVNPRGQGRSWALDKSAFLMGPKTACDFRILRPATVNLEILNPHRRSLKGCAIFLIDPAGSVDGENLDSPPYQFIATPRRYRVEFRDAEERATRLMFLDVKDGETRTLKLTIPKRPTKKRKR